MSEKIISKFFEIDNSHTIDVYEEHGGYQMIRKVLKKWTPEEIVQEVINSNLRGLGGAGFPAGRKWSFIPKDNPKPNIWLLMQMKANRALSRTAILSTITRMVSLKAL